MTWVMGVKEGCGLPNQMAWVMFLEGLCGWRKSPSKSTIKLKWIGNKSSSNQHKNLVTGEKVDDLFML